MNGETWTDSEALSYIASYSDLIAGLGADPSAGRAHFANSGFAEGRKISFQPLSYIASNSDLISAFRTDGIAATKHFITKGFAEGRATSFDGLAYAASYPDLMSAFGTNSAAATEHYILSGFREGRVPSFNALSYIASYGDLIQAFGTDTVAATRHFISSGSREGRAPSFDGLAYLASNSDLIAAFGTNVAAATRHYISTGVTEGRATNFDAVAYLLSQPDLGSSGIGAGGALNHWVRTGFNEGRSGDQVFGREQSNHAFGLGTPATGAIDTAADRDWFKIDLAAGQQIQFSVRGGTGFAGAIGVHDDGGRRITSVTENTASGVQTVSMTAAKAGVYYIVISGSNGYTGGYELSAEPLFNPLIGTSGADTLVGTAGNDLLQGLGGNDILEGRAGNDILEGGDGFDQLDGGLGDDILYGNNAANTGPESVVDHLRDDQGGNDQLFGQDGNDNLSIRRDGATAASTVLMDGGTGEDTITFTALSRYLDSVTIRGGTGNDTIKVGSVSSLVLDAGDGNDTVTINTLGGNQAITLGAGSDTFVLDRTSGSFAVGNPIRVTDFQIGSDKLSLEPYLADVLQGWDRTSNPFSQGYLRLVQSGSDTLLQIDRDGNTNGANYGTLLTLQNTTATAFTAAEIGYAPDGSATPGQTLIGTSGADTLVGTAGNDLLQGLGGNDILEGRAGNDILEGGDGFDQLDGGLGDDILYGNNAANTGPESVVDHLRDDQGGNDQLFGQDGNDNLSIRRDGATAASTVLMDGGTGEDTITFTALSRYLDSVTIRGGTGNDTIKVGSVSSLVLDAGDGNDTVTINTLGGNQAITLGAGSDTFVLDRTSGSFAVGNPIRVTDFQIGSDKLSLEPYLADVLQGWDRTSNPFSQGYLRLVQSGSDTLLQIDRDGNTNGANYGTLLTLQNTTANAFTAAEIGYAPAVAATTETAPTLADLFATENIRMPETVSRFDSGLVFPEAQMWL